MKMTTFEETCKEAGIPTGTIAEQAMAEIVNELILDDVDRTDEEIKTEAIKIFNEIYK